MQSLASSAMAVIPKGLSQLESKVYQKLIRVARCRRRLGGQGPRPIVVITDLGKDYDDLAALVVLKEFHRLGLVELRAVVANLMPADKRARFASAALDSLDLRGIPVARGTRGSPDEHEELAHEFSEFSWPAEVPNRDGQDLLLDVYQNAEKKGEKLYLLCLSSLQDIHEFASTHPHLVAEFTAEVHMQGGNYISKEGKLEPDSKAANNRFNWEAAAAWHSFIQTNALPSHTYTKIAAFAASLTSDVFVELEATGHPIGAYLRRVQVEQDLAFYKRACESDPEKRFAPFMDQKWFLANKTNWHQRAHAEGDALPTDEEVIPYLTKIVLYDVHAALGVAGMDVVEALNLFQSRKHTIDVKLKSQGKVGIKVDHWITDDELSPAVSEKISSAISSLLKGSLLYAVEKLYSRQWETRLKLSESTAGVTGLMKNCSFDERQFDKTRKLCYGSPLYSLKFGVKDLKLNGRLVGMHVFMLNVLKPSPERGAEVLYFNFRNAVGRQVLVSQMDLIKFGFTSSTIVAASGSLFGILRGLLTRKEISFPIKGISLVTVVGSERKPMYWYLKESMWYSISLVIVVGSEGKPMYWYLKESMWYSISLVIVVGSEGKPM